jgi:hypothetical protein
MWNKAAIPIRQSFQSKTDSAEPFDPELTTDGLTADGLVAGRNPKSKIK